MPMTINIIVNSPQELLAYLSAFQVGEITPTQEALGVGTFNIVGEPLTQEGIASSVVTDITEDVAAALPGDKPKRARGRPRKEQAAPEPELDAQNLAEAAQVNGETDPFELEADSNPDEDAQTPRDPAVDHGLALELLRSIYERPGAAPRINALLADYKVSKFTSIPKAQGSLLLAQARLLDAEIRP